MKILVLYKINYVDIRNTILEHLYSFKKYSQNIQLHYFNAWKGVPKYLSYVKYDGIILHYTFLSYRTTRDGELGWKKFIKGIKNLNGYKIALVQDDYTDTDKLCYLFKEYNIETVFTILNRMEDYLKAYPPDKTGLKHYIPVLTGYVDENEARKLKKHILPYKDRPIDIGYRARNLPYYFGRHGQLKSEIADVFILKLRNTNFKFDIATTVDNRNTILGKDWYQFLLKCKAFLGCEGGASLLDTTEEIRKKVMEFIKLYPNATFEEAEKACFPGEDYNIQCFTISPRHFEAAMTKTLQILVEGDYNGIFKPYEHYIPVRKDWSNIDEVLKLLRDNEYCQKIIDRAYNDIVLSGRYTYRMFANLVIEHIKKEREKIKTDLIKNKILFLMVGAYLNIRNFIFNILIRIFFYKPVKFIIIRNLHLFKRLLAKK